MTPVRIASAMSVASDTAEATQDTVGRVAAQLGGARPDLVVFFTTPHHVVRDEIVLNGIHAQIDPRHVLGATAEAVVGDGREVEQGPALSLWAASLPDAAIDPFWMRFVRTGEGTRFEGFPAPGEHPARAVLLVGDPFTFPADALLRHVSVHLAGLPFFGGMASGGRGPGENRLYVDGDVRREGAVGVVLSGEVQVRTLVSQGCRPIGRPYVVTRAEGNVVYELGGRSAVERLEEMLGSLPVRDHELFRRAPHVGIVIDEHRELFGPGDFLVRGVLGADPGDGSVVVGEPVEVGRTIQFHVRDAGTADEDLRRLVAGVDPAPAGALLFTCNGRGSRLFAGPDHDVKTIRGALGDISVAGMFCMGEIGPVGPASFLHGFTASAAFFG